MESKAWSKRIRLTEKKRYCEVFFVFILIKIILAVLMLNEPIS